MKLRMLITLLAMLFFPVLSGCSAAGNTIEKTMDDAKSVLSPASANTASQPSAAGNAAATLSKDEAQAIALEHAGFTADQVTYLRTEYEIDDGIPQYEVQFHQGRWEYDYEINAQTGAILSYDRDD